MKTLLFLLLLGNATALFTAHLFVVKHATPSDDLHALLADHVSGDLAVLDPATVRFTRKEDSPVSDVYVVKVDNEQVILLSVLVLHVCNVL